MPVLDHAIPENQWIQGVQRNGIARQNNHGQHGEAGAWQATIEKLVQFQNLGNDWDGFGAEAPSRELLESAIGLAHVFGDAGVSPPHRVTPGVCGTVHFEWQDTDGTFTDVEIDRPLHAEVMLIQSGKPAKHWSLPTE